MPHHNHSNSVLSLLSLAQLRYERLPWVQTETSLKREDLCKTESSIAGSLLETKPTYLEYLETIFVNSYVTQIWVVLNLRTCGCESAWAYLNIFVELNVLSRVVTMHMFQILRKKDKQECCQTNRSQHCNLSFFRGGIFNKTYLISSADSCSQYSIEPDTLCLSLWNFQNCIIFCTTQGCFQHFMASLSQSTTQIWETPKSLHRNKCGLWGYWNFVRTKLTETFSAVIPLTPYI